MTPTDRNSDPKEIVAVGGSVPSWLTEMSQEDTSTAGMSEHRILPRLKIIQAMSDQGLKDEFGEGAVIISPGNGMVCDKKGYFDVTPLFYFNEFIQWSDRNDSGSGAILDRTFDPSSPLAAKCRDMERRMEDYEGGQASNQEHLNFVCLIQSGPMEGQVVVLSFTKGEFQKGREFISGIHLRRMGTTQVPIYLHLWRFTPSFRERGSKKWFGLDYLNPDGPLYVGDNLENQEVAEAMKQMHEELKKDYDAKRLGADYSEADASEKSDAGTTDEM